MYQTLIKPFLIDAKTFVLDTLFPIKCLRCGAEGQFVCARCLSELKRLEFQYCIVCQKQSLGGFTHPGCLTPHCADGLISVLNYHDETVADILIKGKYNFLPGVYEELGRFLAHEITAGYPLLATGYLLVPLPLHRRRRRWRGFNQSEILCQAMGKELGLPIIDALIRIKSTKTQKDLKREQRLTNVKDAFALSPSPLPARQSFSDGGARGDAPQGQRGRTDDNQKTFDIRGQNFLLVDDVTTTGATLLEAAQVLKRNGATKVWCLTVARD